MLKGLVRILAGLLLISAPAAVLASENACPAPQNGLARPFLHVSHLQIAALSAAPPTGGDGYLLNEALVGDNPAEALRSEAPGLELSAEQDLAALHIRTENGFIPYVGAGVGTGSEPEPGLLLSPTEAQREAERQAYLLGAGLACELSRSARINLGYRYATDLPENSGLSLGSAGSVNDDHHISFGLKLDF